MNIYNIYNHQLYVYTYHQPSLPTDDKMCSLMSPPCSPPPQYLKHKCPIPPQVAQVLRGVILVDSLGLNRNLPKVTDRDIAAVEALEATTAPLPSRDELYQDLNEAKFDPSWWESLSTYDALRYDYKQFVQEKAGGEGKWTYGMSSILLSLDG